MNHEHSYRKLVLMAALSFVAMYVLMYAMVDVMGNVYANYNQFYMAGLMASPMVIIELLLMRRMYMNKRLNTLILLVSIVAMALFSTGIRRQVAIGDEQFLKSMIPHHGAAILMCNEAPIGDPEIRALCADIVSGQQAEIDFMKSKLDSIKRNN